MTRYIKIGDDIVATIPNTFIPHESGEVTRIIDPLYAHNFKRIRTILDMVKVEAKYRTFTTPAAAEYFRDDVISLVNQALSYIPEVNNLGNDRERNQVQQNDDQTSKGDQSS